MQSTPFADSLAVVNLNVSIWAGRAKVRPEDLPENVLSALPPAELATLGSKRLFPLDALRPFGMYKMRAYSYLCAHGTRFLSGFAVDAGSVATIESELASIKADFDKAVNDFLTAYDAGVRNWQAAFPQWASVLSAATPSAADVARRFSFQYQVFTVTPAGTGGALAADMAALPGKALEDIAADVRTLLRETYTDGRNKLTPKSLNPLRGLCEKVDALCFLDTSFAGLSSVLQNALSAVSADMDGPAVPALHALLASLSDAASLRTVAASVAQGTESAQDIWDDALPPTPMPELQTILPQAVDTHDVQLQAVDTHDVQPQAVDTHAVPMPTSVAMSQTAFIQSLISEL